MEWTQIQKQWDGAAPGWAKWEETIATWMKPATEAMLNMAAVAPGSQVLDLACGAGSQTLNAARRVGSNGRVLASDISETMLQYVQQKAQAAHLDNISTIVGPAENVDVPSETFDAAICQLGLMLFVDPSKVLTVVKQALKPGAKVAIVVFTLPETNAFMAKPMQILLRHAGKVPPAAGKPGIFSLGAPGVLTNLLTKAGFTDIEQQILDLPVQMRSTKEAFDMIQEAFGAYRAVVSDCSEAVQQAAWAEVADVLKSFETGKGFDAPSEAIVAAATKAK